MHNTLHQLNKHKPSKPQHKAYLEPVPKYGQHIQMTEVIDALMFFFFFLKTALHVTTACS